MLQVKSIKNQLMQSNCYIILDDEQKHCIVVDPASEKSMREIEFINDANLILDYIILTHEHTDHTWGVNSLLEAFPYSKIVCSRACKEELPKAEQAYFSLYMNNPNYEYYVKRVDMITEDINEKLLWCNHTIDFISTPGHSIASICFSLNNWLFTGDTLMLLKKMYINKKTGSRDAWKDSVNRILSKYEGTKLIFPGHGEPFILKNYIAMK